uniref:Uncharacterized protein n=1 Tax=Romanomermis culicivorax TaxID=13658 RepID=A0A915KP14_ROMCU
MMITQLSMRILTTTSVLKEQFSMKFNLMKKNQRIIKKKHP